MVLLRALPSRAACRALRVTRGQSAFPDTAASHVSKSNTQISTQGRNRESKAEKREKFEAHPHLQLSENTIAKSHPAGGTPGRRPKASREDRREQHRPGRWEGGQPASTCGARRRHACQQRNMEGSRREAAEGGGESGNTAGRGLGAPERKEALRGPDGTRGQRPDGRAAGRRGRGRELFSKDPAWGWEAASMSPALQLPDGVGAERERRRNRLQRGAGPYCASGGTESGAGLSAAGRQVSSRYRQFGSDPAAPVPPHPDGSSNVDPKSLWDQRPQTATSVSGTSRSERGEGSR